ncbi:ATP synthase F1 subunit delta [Buchnera aphidicola]|jgi:F-type H+-transporting ATPase subunit delta|uniref:ATP synthase subunit delta n=1 Tax=Buchnera aphidicola subsp. Schizaphis graminum (strain Sg) TaxID=198804 RepID=ATPD_BUCAP|nr:ATP synthase F1 subunit delta [Buchnera aphidicola]O51875.1 RecName: Full=ATP synthase subunit delta; AltName: Full=ATP synthase F(1) sector subunit delta; AltName: Full=F-type ATPase subunit delta; Short=F-ATPase subunit delta [Buchnera aphidicola str. Sg (Schizaphis graminum)]AAC38113.1 ATP synthase subunit delta [Buchnera aphidicola]AAM67577.1 ATP synthase delta chain [Buchnera aphidicola str. Sg (Schizaphis graminum)]AWI49919.1 ATP synthase F1 subunit delta [Buchnera aphidicola (Schizaph
MSVLDTIARPYAKAIFELAIENQSIEKWKKTLIFINEIIRSKKIEKFLSGSLSPSYLSSFFIFVAGDHIDKDARNLIKLLAENQRFKIFNNILRQFLKLETSYQGNTIIELISAYSLQEHEIIDIRCILQKIFLSKIKFIYKIDHQILDGIIIKKADTVFDFSVRSYLKQLSDVLNF